ncbi:MAG: tetratricopeptide repeat protein, partial [Verrucomicrobiota bacterium]
VYAETALMDRRQGRWAEALQNFDRAIELDPRNLEFLTDAAETRSIMGCYAEATQLGHRARALAPHHTWTRLFIASQALDERADIRPLRAELNGILAKDPGTLSATALSFWDCAIRERDSAAADRALAAIPQDGYRVFYGSILPREWFVGYTARIFDRHETAVAAFTAARAILEKHLSEQPDDAKGWSLLGKTKAALGEKEEAIEAGQRACQIWPLSKEGTWGLHALRHLAVIYAWTVEKDLAIQQLEQYAGTPQFAKYGELKLDPEWDPLRGDPRFEKIIDLHGKRNP